MKYYLILIATILVVGCGFGKPTVKDPCAQATVCWGPAGVSPSDVPDCQQLISCHDWQMGVK